MAEKNKEEILRELIVKLKPVFVKDAYVYKNKYVIGGTKSFFEVPGAYLCILNDKYSEAFEELYPNADLIFIRDLIKFKDDLSYGVVLEDLSKKTEISEKVSDFLKRIDEVDIDNSLVESNPNIIDVIFDKKNNYILNCEDDDFGIVLGKACFPLVTAKTMEKILYKLIEPDDKEEGLYNLYMQYNFTHFQLFMLYNAIPMKIRE